MTEKKFRDDIIVKMLDYRDESNVDIDKFCEAKKITFSSNNQKERFFEDLRDKGYIKCSLYINHNGHFTLTSEGIDYAERLLIAPPLPPNPPAPPIIYTTKENSTKIVDNSVEACFNVKNLAECYVKLIDSACENEQDNVCMFGIFAPWGRGKTYFFRKVKECINERTDSKAIQYDIVEFNAWKYQETPAIWAYLFETLYNSKKWWFKIRYTIRRIWKSISYGLPFLIPTIIIALFYNINLVNTIYQNWKESLTITVSTISAIGLILDFIAKHYNSAISLIKRYSKGISFANELGVQAEIEKEITSLLKFWISEEEAIEKKVILYVDDIDRCSETKMTSIIDSLRTVLENEEIRKRLIIICSIDPEKIIKGIEYKYKTLYDDKELRSIAMDQMDKIFLTGIALSQLNKEQLYEFTSKLAGVDDNSIYKQQLKTRNDQNITTSDGKEVLVVNSPKIEEKMKLDDPKIYKQLKELINNNKKPLTPRKMRIIYYRILLANNIICKMKNPKITNALIQNIFNLSVGEEINNNETSNELSEVLNMVVPYKYRNEVKENEKNEVAS